MRALLIGFYGQSNLGDDLMLVCLRKWLETQGVGAVTVLSENPEAMKRFGIPAVENVPLLGQWSLLHAWVRGRALRVMRAVREHDLVIVGGGDLIRQDHGWRAFSYAAEKIWLAWLLRRPIYILNAGIGEPRTRFQAKVLRATLRLATQIVVRDRRSARACGSVDCTVAPDIVTELPAFVEPVRAEGKAAVVVCLCSNPTFGRYELTEGRLANLAAALDRLAEEGEQVCFLPFHPDDTALHDGVMRHMSRPESAERLEWTGDIAAVAGRIAAAKLVIGMRLHAAVCAAAFGRPCLAMPYEEKVRELAESAGLPMLEADGLDDAAALESAIRASAASRPRRREAVWSAGRISLSAPRR